MKEGNDGGIHDTLCKKPKLDKCSKNDDFSKEFLPI
jgi:hypothetical protein